MKVACAWCQKDLGDKAPFDDPSISHGICEACQKKMTPQRSRFIPPHPKKGSPEAKAWAAKMQEARKKKRRFSKNSKDRVLEYTNPKDPINKQLKRYDLPNGIGIRNIGGQWAVLGVPHAKDKSLFPIRYYSKPYAAIRLAEQYGWRGAEILNGMNPGSAWHERKRQESHSFDTQMRQGKKPTLAMFYHGKEVAHSESAMKARELEMNPEGRVLGHAKPKTKKQRGQRPYCYWEWMGLSPLTGGTTLYQAPRQAGMLGAKSFDDGVCIDFQTGVVFTKTSPNPRRSRSNPLAVFGVGNPKRQLSVPERHQLKIALDTLKMPDAMADVMGGPNKKQAREIIKRLTGKVVKENPRSNGRLNTGIAGIIYHRCLEVRAEKTGSYKPGLYRHPFSQNSGVQILALDNGDLLLHSTRGKKLWGSP